MAIKFLPPVTLVGDPVSQIGQLKSYLYQMSEQLNLALQGVDTRIDTLKQESDKMSGGESVSGSVANVVSEATAQTYNDLRSLIVKTADIVEAEIATLETNFRSDYLARSQFGEFQESLSETIKATAEGIVAQYDYGARIDAVNSELAGMQDYQINSEQYIKVGVVKYNTDGTPVAGVVVGNNLTTVTVDGKEIVTSANMYSCFTANRLGFYRNGVEVAYFSDNALYVNDINVTGKITIGKWQIDTVRGFTLRWIG